MKMENNIFANIISGFWIKAAFDIDQTVSVEIIIQADKYLFRGNLKSQSFNRQIKDDKYST